MKQLGDTDPQTVCAAATALGRSGTKEALPVLKALRWSRHSRVKWSAAEAVWRLEHKAANVMPIFAELLTAPEADVRAASAWRLGRLDVDPQTVLLLAAALRDPELEVRVQAGLALANLGRHAEPALPALVRALANSRLDEFSVQRNPWANALASPALPALVELADDAIPLLIAAVGEDATKQREFARRAAHVIPAFGRRAVAPLLRTLKAKENATRFFGVLALAEVGRVHGLPLAAVDELETCLNDPDKTVRRAAASALSWVRPASPKALALLAASRSVNPATLVEDLERLAPHHEVALELLVQLLEDGQVDTARDAARVLAALEVATPRMVEVWTKAVAHPAADVRSQALEAMMQFGPQAKAVATVLLDRAPRETDLRCKAVLLDAITRIDPDAPALLRLLVASLKDEDSSVRWHALDCLARLGPRAKVAFTELEARLYERNRPQESDDSETRQLVEALVAIAPDSDGKVAVLLKALRHREIRLARGVKDSWLMRDVLEDALYARLPASASALREALIDEDEHVRRSAALVLLRAGRHTNLALPVLMNGLWNVKDDRVEGYWFPRRAVDLLAYRPLPDAPALAAAWCKAWQTGDARIRKTLEPGLLVFQPEALPHLLEQLRQAKTVGAKRDLAHLLARFEGQSKLVLPILREELRDSAPAAQYAAAEALALLGPAAGEAVSELLRLLSHIHPGLRAVALKTLAEIGRPAYPAVGDLKSLLKSANPGLRALAADALSRIAPEEMAALSVFRARLIARQAEGGLSTEGVRLPEGLPNSAVFPEDDEEGIARLGDRGVTLLAELLDNLDLDEWSKREVSTQGGSVVRVRAALQLARLGPEAKAAVPALTRALKDRDPFVREAAASALGQIGTAAQSAAPDVIALLEQQSRTFAAAGPWSSQARMVGQQNGVGDEQEGTPFDFRSLGRKHVLAVKRLHGYFGPGDPYGSRRPAHPHDPAFVLSKIDSEAGSALPLLRALARDVSHPGRLSAALALWRMGEGTADVLAAFESTLVAQTRLPRHAAAPLSREMRECLAELGTQLKPCLRALEGWLKRRHLVATEADQIAVVTALGRLGPAAQSSEELLRSMQGGHPWEARRRVAVALALFRITGDKVRALPVLREALLDVEPSPTRFFTGGSNGPRVHAAVALGVLADAGDDRARTLLGEVAKGDENPYVRLAALKATARR